MDKLQNCASAYQKLLDYQYNIVLERKGKLTTLHIRFTKWDFHHLMGLGKLKDLRIARKNRVDVFDDIIEGRTSYGSITTSRYFSLIENRFEPLSAIESLLDSNETVFRYNSRLNQFSLIEADYLLSTPYEGNDIYIFVASGDNPDEYYCRSFFPKEKKDYTFGQAIYTLLYKAKENLTTGEKIVLYDKLTPKT